MYGAKAEAIAKVAFDTWGTGTLAEAKKFLVPAIHAIAGDPNASVKGLNLPKEYAHSNFLRMTKSLAANPLAA